MKYKNGHQFTGGSHGNAGDGSLKPVWDIVSDLAQALNNAKDQLSSLLHNRGTSPLKRPNHGHHSPRVLSHHNSTNSTTDCVSSHGGLSPPRSRVPRCYSAPHARKKGDGSAMQGPDAHGHGHPQNIHRSHARGYFAFGRNTEFKEQMHRGRAHERQYWEHSGGGGGGHARDQASHAGDHGPKYGIKLEGANGICGIKVIPNGKSYTCKRDRDKKGVHLVAKMKNCHMNVDTDGEKFGPNSPVKIHFSTPSKVKIPTPYQHPVEVKRYCVGTQYANLLREEAHHLREKRIMEQSKIFKNDWKQPP